MAEPRVGELHLTPEQWNSKLGKELLQEWFDAAYADADGEQNNGTLLLEGQRSFVEALKARGAAENDQEKKSFMLAAAHTIETTHPTEMINQYTAFRAAGQKSELSAAFGRANKLAKAIRELREAVIVSQLKEKIDEAFSNGDIPVRLYIEYCAKIKAFEEIQQELNAQAAARRETPMTRSLLTAIDEAKATPITEEIEARFGLSPVEPPAVPPRGPTPPARGRAPRPPIEPPVPPQEPPVAHEQNRVPEWHYAPKIGAIVTVRATVGRDGRVEQYDAQLVPPDAPEKTRPISFNVRKPLRHLRTGEHILLFRVTNARPESADPRSRFFVEAEPVIPEPRVGMIIAPVDFVQNQQGTHFYVLPDGARVQIHAQDFAQLNPATGRYLDESGEPTDLQPKIKLTRKIREDEFEGRIEPRARVRTRIEFDAIMRQYIFGARALRNLPPRAKEFVEQVERLGLLAGEDSLPEGVGRQLRRILESETEKEPQYVVVSARGTNLHKGFEEIQQWFAKYGRKFPEHAEQMTELISAAREANEAMTALEQMVKEKVLVNDDAQREYTAKYIAFFEKLHAFQSKPGADGRQRNLRLHYFTSDLDGECSNAVFNKAGIRTLVIPQLPNIVPEGVENVRGAVYLDSSHSKGTVIEPREGHIAIFLDEDNRNTFSATHAALEHFRELGMLREGAHDLQDMHYVVAFVNAIDNYAGPYAEAQGIRAIYDNYATNIYGIAHELINRGRPDLVLSFFKKEMDKIMRVVHEQEREEAFAGGQQTITREQRVLRILTWYNARPFFERLKVFKGIEKNLDKSREYSEKGIQTLEKNQFVITTDFGKTLVDVSEQAKMPDGKTIARGKVKLKGLAAFAHGYDAYISYNPFGRICTVNLRPGLQRKLPDPFLVDAQGNAKGNVVKDGRLFAMNATSTPLEGLHEILDAMSQHITRKDTDAIAKIIRQEAGATAPPPPDETKLRVKKGDRPFVEEMKGVFAGLRPELLQLETAQLILAGEQGAVSAYLDAEFAAQTSMQRKITAAVYTQWWSGLTAEQKHAFILAARQKMREDEKVQQIRVTLETESRQFAAIIGQLSLEERAALYQAIRTSTTVEVPAAVQHMGGHAGEAWKKFVSEWWYPSLAPRLRYEYSSVLHDTALNAQRRRVAQAEVERIQGELDALNHFTRRFGLMSATERRRQQNERHRLEAALADAERKLHEAKTGDWLDAHMRAIDAQLDRVARAHGWDAAAVNTARVGSVNVAARTGTHTVGGATYIHLMGTPTHPEQYGTSPILLAAAEEARRLRAEGKFASIVTSERHSIREIKGMAHTPVEETLLLQQQIVAVFGQAMRDHGSLEVALSHEPLQSLYAEYKRAVEQASLLAAEQFNDQFAATIQLQDDFFAAFKIQRASHRTFDESIIALKGAAEKLKKAEAGRAKIEALNRAAREAAEKKKQKKKKGEPAPDTSQEKKFVSAAVEAAVSQYAKDKELEVVYAALQTQIEELEQTLGTVYAREIRAVLDQRMKLFAEIDKKQPAIDRAKDTSLKAALEGEKNQLQRQIDSLGFEPEKNPGIDSLRHTLRIDSFVSQAVVRMEAELFDRMHSLHANVRALFNETQQSALGRTLQALSTTFAERAAAEPLRGVSYSAEFSDYRFTHDVKPFDTPLSVVKTLMQQMHAKLSDAEIQRMATQFLGVGKVADSGRQFAGSFMRDGHLQGTLFAGDHVIARRDVGVPFGFRIEIQRARALRTPKHPGYIEYDDVGRPEYYYEAQEGGVVEVWQYDSKENVKRKVGSFDANRQFTQHTERAWEYTNEIGETRSIPESDTNHFFTADGHVVIFEQGETSGKFQLKEVGRTDVKLGPILSVDRGDNKTHLADTRTGNYCIDPRGNVWELDPILGPVELGALSAHQQAQEALGTRTQLSLVQRLQASA